MVVVGGTVVVAVLVVEEEATADSSSSPTITEPSIPSEPSATSSELSLSCSSTDDCRLRNGGGLL